MFVAFACDGTSVMLDRIARVATQLCARLPDLFVWHCSNQPMNWQLGMLSRMSVDLIIKRFSLINCTLYIMPPQQNRENWFIAQTVGQRLLAIGRDLSISWVASSERTVKAVWENYKVLQVHFSSATKDVTRDSTERAKYKGLHDVLTSVTFVFNLGVMYDALTELSDL